MTLSYKTYISLLLLSDSTLYEDVWVGKQIVNEGTAGASAELSRSDVFLGAKLYLLSTSFIIPLLHFFGSILHQSSINHTSVIP